MRSIHAMVFFWVLIFVAAGALAVTYVPAIYIVLTDPRFSAYPELRLFIVVIGIPAVIGGLWVFSLLFRVRRS